MLATSTVSQEQTAAATLTGWRRAAAAETLLIVFLPRRPPKCRAARQCHAASIVG